jgi:hypothetical protein
MRTWRRLGFATLVLWWSCLSAPDASAQEPTLYSAISYSEETDVLYGLSLTYPEFGYTLCIWEDYDYYYQQWYCAESETYIYWPAVDAYVASPSFIEYRGSAVNGFPAWFDWARNADGEGGTWTAFGEHYENLVVSRTDCYDAVYDCDPPFILYILPFFFIGESSAQAPLCGYPRSEETGYLGIPPAPGRYGGQFQMILEDRNGTQTYTGRQITESFSQVAFNCYRNGDPGDPPSALQLNAQASTWTVNLKTYGLDFITDNALALDFYQNRLRNEGGGACLVIKDLQTVSMSTCAGRTPGFQYESHWVDMLIHASPDSMTVSRDNETDKPAKP